MFSNHQQYSSWNISLFYYCMSACQGTKYVSGHKHVWAQTYMFLPWHDCDHTIITCQGTNVSGHKHVWAQSCLGTNVCGHNRVRAQTCLGTIVSRQNRVGTIVWAQVCMGTIVWSPSYHIKIMKYITISNNYRYFLFGNWKYHANKNIMAYDIQSLYTLIFY